ncbi:class I SAM-dependent methyltransferase [Pseudomonas japonica]|uniref:Methyltransferase domain-containing protein n=1 Tax=Pseudomonas japonica TaxID=256466 RepID=A0A239LUW5_9PSED|nr:class I SAM-dependent methyltransferase [Pseudomonas japonica]SNT34251.1 Methyltransferase domain-containing protein [Pseudomonas japonica]
MANEDARILASWQTNADPWISAVREAQIESRRLVTDRALLAAIDAQRPRTVLDLGCGEGWLCRALLAWGIRTWGVDATASLVDAARAADPAGDYDCLDYAAFSLRPPARKVDLVACNFSLFGAEELNHLLASLPQVLNPGGHLLIQTLHPHVACGDGPYADGWREGSWAGFDAAFSDPAPWYFRTLESWVTLLGDSGFRLQGIGEPLHPITGRPASLLLVAGVG